LAWHYIVRLLTLVFGVDIRRVGASLVSIIATPSGAAAPYVKQGFVNIRVGMLLEVATTIGALAGAYVSAFLPASTIAVVFAVVLLFTAAQSFRPHAEHVVTSAEGLALRLRLGFDVSGRNTSSATKSGGFRSDSSSCSSAGALSAVPGSGPAL